jgi:hypothetical protein
MKRSWLILFTTVLALLGTLPRLHCLCNSQEVLLVTASVMDCCHARCVHAEAGTSMNGTDLSCFRNADSQALGGLNRLPNPSAPIVAVVAVRLAPAMVLSEFIGSSANATRGPPFLRQYSLGLYLLHGVLLT